MNTCTGIGMSVHPIKASCLNPIACGSGSRHRPSVPDTRVVTAEPNGIINNARLGVRPTIMDEIVGIVREHGAGDRGSANDILVELVEAALRARATNPSSDRYQPGAAG